MFIRGVVYIIVSFCNSLCFGVLLKWIKDHGRAMVAVMTTRHNSRKIDGRRTKPATSQTWVDKTGGITATVLLLHAGCCCSQWRQCNVRSIDSVACRLFMHQVEFWRRASPAPLSMWLLVYLACLSSQAKQPRPSCTDTSSLSHKLFINNFVSVID